MTKFNTTNSNLFTNKNKEIVPEWMQNLTDDLLIKERQIQDIGVNKRGVFAENQQVYRTEVTADPRYLENNYGESKLLADSKIKLAKFLSGKYYKVIKASPAVDFVNLEVKIDSVPANFSFPFEVKASKLTNSPVFYVGESEYPFSKAGLEECLIDIKNGTLKTASKPEAVGKAYVINREEIIRRFNGSLREATDKINQLLNEGSIVGAGSNSYASFMDVDQLFPQMEKQASEEKLSEFYFAPNQEHVATQEFKSANSLTVEASKILNEHFKDFKITASSRKGNELFVKTIILADNGVRNNVEILFNIKNEKIANVNKTKIENHLMEFKQLVSKINNIENQALNKYLLNNKVRNHLNSKFVFTKKDITAKLFKIVESSKIDNLVDTWIEKGLIVPINSSTYAANNTFEELLANSNIDVMSDENIKEIESCEQHFGQELEIETDVTKPNYKVREVEDKGNVEQRLFNANSYINKHLKQYKIASFKDIDANKYQLNVEFINKTAGTKHNVPFEITFEGSKVTSCVAILDNKKINLDKLVSAFANNKVLSLYLQDKNNNMNAGSIVISTNEMKRKLSSVVTSSRIEPIINNWISEGKVSLLNSETLASENSLGELLATISDEDIITDDEKAEANYRKQHFGKEIKVDTDEEKIEDTGVREAEENWSSERKMLAASNQIGKLFKDFSINATDDSVDYYYVTTSVVNPASGLKMKLGFNFKMNDGKLGELIAIDNGQEQITPNDLNAWLRENVSAVNKHFAEYNKVTERSYNVVISKANLENKLKTVVNSNKVASIIENLVSNKLIQPISSLTFASKYNVAELISMTADQLSVEEGREEIALAARDENKLSLEENHIMDSDSRALQTTVRELNPQMITAKEKLINVVYRAASNKKITQKKSEIFVSALEDSKTIQDLELIAKQIHQYLK